MMFRPECCVLSYSLLLYCTMCIDRRLPAPEVDEAASDSDGEEGDGEGNDRQQNNRNNGLIATYNRPYCGRPIVYIVRIATM